MANPYEKLNLNERETQVVSQLVDAMATLLHRGYHDLDNTDKDRAGYLIANAGVRACLAFAQNLCLLKYYPISVDYELGVQTRQEAAELIREVITFAHQTADETAKGNLN